jgi:hypothetical protein
MKKIVILIGFFLIGFAISGFLFAPQPVHDVKEEVVSEWVWNSSCPHGCKVVPRHSSVPQIELNEVVL